MWVYTVFLDKKNKNNLDNLTSEPSACRIPVEYLKFILANRVEDSFRKERPINNLSTDQTTIAKFHIYMVLRFLYAITHISWMEFPIIINWTIPFHRLYFLFLLKLLIELSVSKQWRSWSDVWSGSALFVYVPQKGR